MAASGSSAKSLRWASEQAPLRGAPADSWLAGMLARKPKMLGTVALANKNTRIVRALPAKGGIYRAPVAAT